LSQIPGKCRSHYRSVPYIIFLNISPLTPWWGVDHCTPSQLFTCLYGHRMFVRVCTKPLTRKISWTTRIKSIYAYYFSKNHSVLSSNSSHSLQVSLCFWGFPFRNL